ncbi:MAG: glycosyltransferase [Gammaproteobacteria bacterium]|nr:glycosyltransferase [Gammaproteobacteria bacterium]
MALSEIHPVVITRDASRTLAVTLESLRAFPEVIVYDNGSTDDTLSIARGFQTPKSSRVSSSASARRKTRPLRCQPANGSCLSMQMSPSAASSYRVLPNWIFPSLAKPMQCTGTTLSSVVTFGGAGGATIGSCASTIATMPV